MYYSIYTQQRGLNDLTQPLCRGIGRALYNTAQSPISARHNRHYDYELLQHTYTHIKCQLLNPHEI